MSISYENGIQRSIEMGTKTDQNFLTRSYLKRRAADRRTKLKNKVNEHDPVQNFELSSFTHDYIQGFKEMNKRQKIRDQLFKEWEYTLKLS
jgi:hypothetical protein